MSPGILAEIERLVRPEHRQRAADLYLVCGNLYVQDGVPLDPRTVEIVEPGRGMDAEHCPDCGHSVYSHSTDYQIGGCYVAPCACQQNRHVLMCSGSSCDCGDAIGHGERGGPKP